MKTLLSRRHRLLLPSVLSVVALANLLVMPFFHRAAAFTGITNPSVEGALGNDRTGAESGATFVAYFIYIWNALMVVGGLVLLLYFIQAAIEWITAGGDSGKITKARDRMIQSTIGFFILVFSFVIVNYVSSLLFGGSFNILNLSLPSVGTLQTTP